MKPLSCHSHRIGLVAGWGRFPIVVAQALRAAGREVICCGVRGHADPELAKICFRFQMFGMGKMGAQRRFLQRHGVTEATMAGKIFKTLLFQRFQLFRHLPDLACLHHFYPILISKTRNRADDTLLSTVIELFASGGIRFSPATDFVPELLVKSGTLTQGTPNRSQQLDIAFGWQLAKAMGRLDVGQSVAVKDRAVLAVEAIEGTDGCIQRAGQLCKRAGFTVVKVAKPQQDMRFDVPTVGMATIETMAKSGARVLAIEADRTILLDQELVIRRANQLGISIVALPDRNFASITAA